MFTMRVFFVLSICIALAAMTPLSANAQDKTMNVFAQPHYKNNPVYLFFENYILDVIGQLPPEKSRSIQTMNLQKVLKTKATEWHESLRETLDLSSTIDIAILDLWYQNQDIAHAKGVDYPAQQFAVNFTDEYITDGNQVDVWRPGALEAAKKRIAAYRAKNPNH